MTDHTDELRQALETALDHIRHAGVAATPSRTATPKWHQPPDPAPDGLETGPEYWSRRDRYPRNGPSVPLRTIGKLARDCQRLAAERAAMARIIERWQTDTMQDQARTTAQERKDPHQ